MTAATTLDTEELTRYHLTHSLRYSWTNCWLVDEWTIEMMNHYWMLKRLDDGHDDNDEDDDDDYFTLQTCNLSKNLT